MKTITALAIAAVVAFAGLMVAVAPLETAFADQGTSSSSSGGNSASNSAGEPNNNNNNRQGQEGT